MVVDKLLEAGASGVRALRVNPVKAALPQGVEVVHGYIGRPDSLRDALVDVDRMYLASMPETVDEVIRMAQAAGVRRIVDLSGERDSWWYPVAEAVEQSGSEWTHIAPGEFMENTYIWAEQIRSTGEVRDAFANAANAMIAMDDVAAAASAALLEDGHVGKTYPLTGPEMLTRAEQVRLIGEALGRDIPFIELPLDEAAEVLSAAMGEFATWYLENKASLVETPQQPGMTLTNVTGQPATTFADWVVRHAGAFR